MSVTAAAGIAEQGGPSTTGVAVMGPPTGQVSDSGQLAAEREPLVHSVLSAWDSGGPQVSPCRWGRKAGKEAWGHGGCVTRES